MPTIFSHALVPLAAGAAAGRARVSPPLALVGAWLAIVPDFDVVGFRFGITYASEWGHRGFTHSLLFAGIMALLVALVWREARSRRAVLFLFCAMASHTLLDLLTDGGQGVAIFWPFDLTRYFLPWQPIRVSPIGARFFTERGLETVWSELALIWLPALAAAGVGMVMRRRRGVA
jgi:inner membrane protein